MTESSDDPPLLEQVLVRLAFLEKQVASLHTGNQLQHTGLVMLVVELLRLLIDNRIVTIEEAASRLARAIEKTPKENKATAAPIAYALQLLLPDTEPPGGSGPPKFRVLPGGLQD
jgi:hypothetical protein